MEKTARYFNSVSTFLLVLLWVYAAVSKLADFARFRSQMHRQPLPPWMQEMLLHGLPPLELLVALALMRPTTQQAGFKVSALLLFLFTGYIGLALFHVFGQVPCSCGGILEHMGWGEHLVFNLFFLALTTINIYLQQRKEDRWLVKV